MANVGYADINTQDAATLLGTTKWNVQYWCKNGYIRYINVGEGNYRPRYMFTEDEIDRVSKLIEKYGKRGWIAHVKEELAREQSEQETTLEVTDPEDYIPDNTKEIIEYLKKIHSLEVQRDRKLIEREKMDNDICNIEAAIETLKQKARDSI